MLITITMPLWLIIVIIVCLVLVTLYLCLSDLMAKIFFKQLTKKELDEKNPDGEKIVLTRIDEEKNKMKKAEIKTEQKVYYITLWEAHYIAPTYLKELLKGAKEQHRNLIEYDDIDKLGVAYILANGDRFVIVQNTDKKKPENSYNVYDYQRKVK